MTSKEKVKVLMTLKERLKAVMTLKERVKVVKLIINHKSLLVSITITIFKK